MRQQALDSGMAIRPITSAEILAHLIDFGIDQQLAHGKIRQMSGGQRQRLVICTAFWSKPHLIALDEPTNYLDNDTLAALTLALKTFKGAVVTVSHKEAFVAEISNEKWVVQDGAITCVQLRDAKAR
jgi:ATPase subunit of ABC transporter with duplicated ATPase domains